MPRLELFLEFSSSVGQINGTILRFATRGGLFSSNEQSDKTAMFDDSREAPIQLAQLILFA